MYQASVSGTSGNDVISATVPVPTNFPRVDYDEDEDENESYSDDGFNSYYANINAGDGNDKITLTSKINYSSRYHTYAVNYLYGIITGGKGNDTITSNGNFTFNYADGDGNDVLNLSYMKGYNNCHAYVNITSGTIDNYNFKGKNLTFNIGNGSIKFKNMKTRTFVWLNANNEKSVYINGKKFNNNVVDYDHSENGEIVSSEDIHEYEDNFIPASLKGDVIGYHTYTYRYDNEQHSISGTTGNDYIDVSNNGEYEQYGHVTVNAGLGDDYIDLSKHNVSNAVIRYSLGDGNDTIHVSDYWHVSYDENIEDIPTIQIGASYKKSVSGKNITLKVGSNKVLLENAKDKVKIVSIDGDGNVILDGLSYNSDSTAVTLSNDFVGNFLVSNFKSSITDISAAKRTKPINITGSASADLIIGGTKADSLLGGDGNDTLNGGNGKDSLMGGAGDDSLLGGAGNDYLNGGTGDDILNGGADNDYLYGGEGDDALIGGNGNDTLYGVDGNDSLLGGAGNDRLFGYYGDDTLVGGKGNDTLRGGFGNDVFLYTSGDGNDVIADFVNSNIINSNDIIKLGNAKTKVNEKKSKVSGNDYILAIGSNTIKLKGAAKMSITVVDYDDTSKVYNQQSSYEERWFDDDDNFITNELTNVLIDSSNSIATSCNFNEVDYQNKYLLTKSEIYDGIENQQKQI
ncbi:MAG: hypothetical protein IJ862_00250 [Selenomonadaceae bacterium]|nr:hypothetical protein [Selenomonadaceae bacterium]